MMFVVATAQHSVFVDKKGIMRWKDTNEAAYFYGTNYTAPFAYAYRALERKGIDHKTAIDRDVYHFARLGFNAFRLHIWDVEITDSVGNLLENEHLDLLDYLVAQAERRGISVLLTLQTNFGNGYPELNVNTGAYSYLYEKCKMHDEKASQEAQACYAAALMKHHNPYNNTTYGSDPNIVGFEINNEPCHSGTVDEVRNYINMMAKTMREAGCTRPIFYNASHNSSVAEAFFTANIDGCTYQWYPVGLVRNHELKGNLSAAVREYPIPFEKYEGFASKAKIIYEFDPADNGRSYMYPMMALAFRKAGVQWATQFAYDPIDIAESNCEYQTHYMNLAYTPRKALAQMVAHRLFTAPKLEERNIAIDAVADNVVYNDGETFISVDTQKSIGSTKKLSHIAGVGSSALVDYAGTGAYFLDRVEEGMWRLEVMPNAVQLADPYDHPNPNKQVVTCLAAMNEIAINVDEIGSNFTLHPYANAKATKVVGNKVSVSPGVYIILSEGKSMPKDRMERRSNNNFRLEEFVAPDYAQQTKQAVVHQAPVESLDTVRIEATVVGNYDSLIVCPSWVNMWNANNPSKKLEKLDKYTYACTLPQEWASGGQVRYYIVAYANGQATTYPQAVEASPIDWNFPATEPYTAKVRYAGEEIKLIESAAADKLIDPFSAPAWDGLSYSAVAKMPNAPDALSLRFGGKSNGENRYFIKKYVGDIVDTDAGGKTKLILVAGSVIGVEKVRVLLTDVNGITFAAEVANPKEGKNEIPLAEFAQTATPLLPVAFPGYMPLEYNFAEQHAFNPNNIEYLTLEFVANKGEFQLVGVVLK